VITSTDMMIAGIEPLPENLPAGSLLVVPGVSNSSIDFDTPQALSARNWLMRMQPAIYDRQISLVCICSGAVLAARSGLLRGVQCTTHHEVISRLKAAEPAAMVKENRIFVEDRGIWSSAGITAGIDLSLHLIHHLCGAQMALNVAREMVVYFRRSVMIHSSRPGCAIATICTQLSIAPKIYWCINRNRIGRWKTSPHGFTSAPDIWLACSDSIWGLACGNITSN